MNVMFLTFLTCCLVLKGSAAHQNNAEHQSGTHDALANNLLSALSNFIEAHSEELSEEMQTELDNVQISLEHQKNKTEELENELQFVAENAMVGPKCDGVIVGSFCYVVHNQKLSFEVANTTCLQKSGLLAKIDSQHHYNQVMEYVLQHDVFTDRAVVFIWTGLQPENDDDDEYFFRWRPSYPREIASYDRVAWQIASSINYGDHGHINVPKLATAYPLCQRRLEIEIESTTTSTTPTTTPPSTTPTTTPPSTTPTTTTASSTRATTTTTTESMTTASMTTQSMNTTAERCFNGYNYTWIETKYTWNNARLNCQNQGGDLAHHGFDSLSFREELLCGHFGRCDNGYTNEWPWIGLKKVSDGQWEYLNGDPSPFDDNLWRSQNDYDHPNHGCSALYGVEYGHDRFLQTLSWLCDSDPDPSICEFAC